MGPSDESKYVKMELKRVVKMEDIYMHEGSKNVILKATVWSKLCEKTQK